MGPQRMTAVPHSLRASERRDRQESKALVVAISVLQLGLVVVVWLLALVPAAVLALAALLVQGARGLVRGAVSSVVLD